MSTIRRPVLRPHTRGAGRRLAPLALLISLVLTLAACGSPGSSGSDDGPVTITMWARSVTAPQSQALVDAYNASHDNQVSLTVVPFDSYLQKVTAAAGGEQLPDLLAANVVEAPNYAELGLWTDLGDWIDSLDFADSLAPSHLQAATVDDTRYAVPHVVDTSALYFNRRLLDEAGVDTDNPAPTLDALAKAAGRVVAADSDSIGLYVAGNCGGCLAFTVWPSVWASGGEVLNPEGTDATLDSPEAAKVFAAYHAMASEGSIPAAARNESGPTQNEPFGSGRAAFSLLGSKALSTIPESDKLEIGVAPIPGVEGGRSSFVGGDVLGVSANSEQQDAAWEFIEWTLGEQAQVEVLAKAKNLTVRTDLASNTYSKQDPRLVLLNDLVKDGRTPYAQQFFATFNDPNGPGLALARGAIFEGSAGADLTALNDAVTAGLQRR